MTATSAATTANAHHAPNPRYQHYVPKDGGSRRQSSSCASPLSSHLPCLEHTLQTIENVRKSASKMNLEPNMWLSMCYFLWDMTLVWTCLLVLYPALMSAAAGGTIDQTSEEEPFHLQKTLLLLVWFMKKLLYSVITGSCIFKQYVVGHDCMHGSFCDRDWWLLNDSVGHYCLAMIGGNFYSMVRCHRQHHLHHNHVNKDAHIPWVRSDLNPGVEWLRSPLLTPIIMMSGMALNFYLGVFDGFHMWPIERSFLGGILWKRETPLQTRAQTVFSTIFLGALLYGLYRISQWLEYNFVEWYLYPLLCAHLWLFVVAYLEHHDDDNLVWDDDSSCWNFTIAALETVDRVYGYGLDEFFHHASDGHLAHHLFFGVPHYRLPRLTQLIHELLDEAGIPYKQHIHQYDPLTECWRCFRSAGLDVFHHWDSTKDK